MRAGQYDPHLHFMLRGIASASSAVRLSSNILQYSTISYNILQYPLIFYNILQYEPPLYLMLRGIALVSSAVSSDVLSKGVGLQDSISFQPFGIFQKIMTTKGKLRILRKCQNSNFMNKILIPRKQ